MLQYQNYDFPDETEAVDKSDFTSRAQKYLDSLINSIHQRFPQSHLVVLSLLGILDPRNIPSASSGLVLELASAFNIDPPKLWNEFQSYRSSVNNFQPATLQEAVCMMWNKDVRDSMTAAFPNISKLLARAVVLPASSASVERVFSTMNRIKMPLRNRLKSSTQDALIQILMTGPSILDFDPLPAALKWKSQGNRRIRLLHSSSTTNTSSDRNPDLGTSSTDRMQSQQCPKYF